MSIKLLPSSPSVSRYFQKKSRGLCSRRVKNMSQTNKEFVDALDIRPEDTFLAVAVRRAAARQLGKEVVDLETKIVGEPKF